MNICFHFRNTFGREDNIITIIYKPNDILDRNLYIELEELVYTIESLKGVKNVASIFSLSDLDLNAWLGDIHDQTSNWDRDTIFQKLKYIQADPSIGSRILSKDFQYGAIIIALNDNANNHQSRAIIIALNDNANNHQSRTNILEEIKTLNSSTSPEWIYSGVSVLRTEYVRYMLRDNFLFLPPIAFLLISILSFIFRNWVYVLLPILTVLVTVIWLLGIMGLTGLEINIMTYIVPTLLFIIGIGDAINIQARFRENLGNNSSNPIDAMSLTINQMSKVIFLTSITTAIGFLA